MIFFRKENKGTKSKRRVLKYIVITVLFVYIVCGLIAPLSVTEYQLYYPALPEAFAGYRILQISDLQNSTNPEILPLTQTTNPDIIVLTGDTFYHKMDEETVEWTLAFLEQLCKIAPVYAVSGNHDKWNLNFEKNLLLMEETGVVNSENQTQTIEKNGEEIHIMGISDPSINNSNEAYDLVEEYLQQTPSTDGFDILLFHRANMLELFKGKGFELILSGHIHGGQFRLPIVGGVISPEGKFFPRYDSGLYAIDDTTKAIVSRGIGNTFIMPRFYNPSELVLITLYSE